MLQQALGWTSSYLESVLLSQARCCCSAEIDDNQAKGAYLVPSEWSAYESSIRPIGQLSETVDMRPPPVTGRIQDPGIPREESYGDEDGAREATNEVVALRDLMKRFVRDMVHGKEYHVVIEHGQTEPCKLSLTQNLMCLQLEAAGVTHDIPLKNVKDVCSGKLLTNNCSPITLDNLCSTLVLRNNTCVTFRLGSISERDEFTKCVKVLALTIEQ
uniref:ISP1 C-terminal domain-containing protein n=1 Tax=Pyrodinium bahamense TaxID=73915 RepID=A0A7S0A4M3_9DINO|mmetsp:Transcript_21080/g.58413  ORF Transcript_21080/g.58413 Transcript_21080/m.58413 type:complete len:215 (+) Transcript_21080:166-810(+)